MLHRTSAPRLIPHSLPCQGQDVPSLVPTVALMNLSTLTLINASIAAQGWTNGPPWPQEEVEKYI
jgi:hypothetical protein